MKLGKTNLQIAIDGLVSSGKSTGAKALADRLKILFINTGSMYRALAYHLLESGHRCDEEEYIRSVLQKVEIKLLRSANGNRHNQVLLNGKNVTANLKSLEVSQGASLVSTIPEVRKYMVKQQQKMAAGEAVVMEGRDIAARVLPQADLKIYMTASLEVRAQRFQHDAWLKLKKKITLSKALAEIKQRDYRDTHRQVDPLRVHPEAWILDTTRLSIKQEVNKIVDKLRTMGLVSANGEV